MTEVPTAAPFVPPRPTLNKLRAAAAECRGKRRIHKKPTLSKSRHAVRGCRPNSR